MDASDEPFNCPICKAPVEEKIDGQLNPLFPFCSQRCKLIDLGRWMKGSYQIAVEDDDLDESENDSE